jgi:hypothetical protein
VIEAGAALRAHHDQVDSVLAGGADDLFAGDADGV